ncbi:MAG: glycerophosphoryl diester phosphodiesterase membrane domain-containing protein [Atopobiaceae bacterium]|jgi:glycerophosphoryl diester phosphodiesterase
MGHRAYSPRLSASHIGAYISTIPGIIYYQLVSSITMGVVMLGLKHLGSFLLLSTGHPAITSGSFGFMFTTWQGYALIALGILALSLYTVFDINLKIIFADKVLSNKPTSTWELLQESARTLPLFANPQGILLVLFVSLIAPLTGLGLSVSVTRTLKVPDFVTSVIFDKPLYLAIYCAVIISATVVCIRYVFTFHVIVLRQVHPKEALGMARRLMQHHWKRCICHLLFFSLVLTLVILVPVIIATLAALVLPELAWGPIRIFVAVLLGICVGALIYLASLVVTPLLILELTRLFLSYERDAPVTLMRQSQQRRGVRLAQLAACALVLVGISALLTTYVDEIFPATSSVGIIAHRAGGTLAQENSPEGILLASRHGAFGAETDVQRTADGAYIIQHDTTFKRLYGVNKRPQDMTLAEIQELSGADGARVPTLEELLEQSRSCHIKLFIELKGKTADARMVDDVVRMVKEHDMVHDVALISLNYEVVDYAERTYPEFETGYLYFLSYGQVGALNVDDLIIEEQLATEPMIDTIKLSNKRCYVWTVNSDEALDTQLNGYADGIITDEVALAQNMKRDMQDRTIQERILGKVLYWIR